MAPRRGDSVSSPDRKEDMDTIMTLFGPETAQAKKKIRLRSIRAVYKTELVREVGPAWLPEHCTSAANVFELFRDLGTETKEHFLALHLDTKNRILCFDRVSVGSLSASIVHPREVYKSALLSSAAAILFMHNHPSGDPYPSREDLDITKRLKECGELLGIRVLDHVVIGHDRYYSFADHGNL